MIPAKKKRPGEDFGDLLGEEPLTAEGDEFEEDYSEDDEFGEETDPMADPLAADPMGMSSIDPEQAQLAETLGFTEPEQQQALIDLIKLVTAPAPTPMEGF